VAITRVGAGTNNGNTITIPSHRAGDLIVISASRSNNTGPTIPSPWIQIQRAGANTLSLSTGYIIATGSSHTSGTWTNAARMTVAVYRPTTGGTLSIGASTTVNQNSQTHQRYPALTLSSVSASSRAVIYTYTRANTSGASTAPTDWTNVNNIATAPIIGLHERFGVTANPTQQNVTGLTSGAYRTHGFEIRYNAPPTVALNTPNEEEFATSTPTLEFTGTDPEGDDVTYRLQIFDNSDTEGNIQAPAAPTTTQFSSSVTSMAVNMPPVTDPGDLLIALVHVRNDGTWTKPDDWNDISGLSQLGGGSVGKLDGFYKIADGTESGATWTASTATTAVWQVIRVAGWNDETPPVADTSSGDVSAADPPNLAPSWGSAHTLWLAVAGHSAASDSAWNAAPTNYSGFTINGVSAGGASVSLATAYRILEASSENPGTFTVDGSNRWWAAATIGIRPAGKLVVEVFSSLNDGFANIDTPADTDPFNSGDKVGYTVGGGA
jgi:hypothetical protein